MIDTIFAVSSGQAPAAIAIIRVSGPAAQTVMQRLAGVVPPPRRATLRRLRDGDDVTLDHALVLWFPGPETATGEDLAEFHVHGGRAVIVAVERAIAAVPGARRAEAGEFTRRALMSGRIDLAQAAGFADLLEAETETQRRTALSASEGAFSGEVRGWLARLSDIRAVLEAAIDHDGEGDIPATDAFAPMLAVLVEELGRRLAVPTSEQVRAGWRVVLAGPRNAGKSALFNAMLGRHAAIVAAVPGTTRDRIEARVQRGGELFTLVDTAGLAEWTDDPIEAEGIRLSREAMATADLVLWMGEDAPPGEARATLWLAGRCDERTVDDPQRLAVSTHRLGTTDALWEHVVGSLAGKVSATEPYLLQDTQREVVVRACRHIGEGSAARDPLIQAEHLRRAGAELGTLLGLNHTEAMLDALFSRFCLGK